MAEKTSLKARLLLNVFLLFCLVGLFLFIQFWPTDKVNTTISISELIPDEVDFIKIRRKEKREIILKKDINTWHMTQPYHTRVTEFQIDRILEIATAKSEHKINDYDRESFGFTSPEITVTINEQTFLFGLINQITNEQYLETQDTAYLIAPHLGYSIPGDLEKFFSHKLLSDDETPISIDFGSWKASQKSNGAWETTGLSPKDRDYDLSQDQLNQWVAGWQLTSSLSARPFEESFSGLEVKIQTSSGNLIDFHIIKNKRGHLFIRADEKMSYQLGEDAGNRLLDPFEVADPQS